MIFEKYTRNAYATRLVILLGDTVMAVLAIAFATLLRFNFDLTTAWDSIFQFGWIFILVRTICFRWFKTYAVIVRYAGASDVVQVGTAVGAGTILLFGLSVVLKPFGILIPKSIVLIEYFLMLSIMSVSRLLMPTLFYVLFSNREKQEQAIIIGAGKLGAITRNIIRQDADAQYNIVGIFDDNKDSWNNFLMVFRFFHLAN